MSERSMKNFLDYASKRYYEGTPVLSDAEFDRLAETYSYHEVGYAITDGVPHLHKMYSLQKVFSEEDLPSDIETYIRTPKLDGAAISLSYINGQLALGLTRGDGNIGKDITEKMEHVVPKWLSGHDGIIQIVGEVVFPKVIMNARNYAAGTLNLKDVEEFKDRVFYEGLKFVAYDVMPRVSMTYETTLEFLERKGFNTVSNFIHEDYPTDGWVYRKNNNTEYERMGYTSHHPRGSIALKEQKEGVVTTLTDVKWQVGKSGAVSPVGILEPVNIDGAVVSRATLHNIAYIESLELEIGCQVEVIRSGEIIPRILRRVF